MPEPISSNSAPSAPLCEPNNACCEEPSAAAPSGAPAPSAPGAPLLAPSPSPHVITIPPVYISGDASEQLTKHYDQQAAAACRNERNAAVASCPNIGAAALESGPLTAHVASLVCAQLIAAYDDCKDTKERHFKINDFCNAQGMVAAIGAGPDDVICWKLPE